MLLWTVIESPWSHHDSAETRSSTSNPQFRLRPREVPSCLLARQTTAPFSAAIAAASSIKNASNFVQNCSAFDLSSPSTFPFYGAPFLFSSLSLSVSIFLFGGGRGGGGWYRIWSFKVGRSIRRFEDTVVWFTLFLLPLVTSLPGVSFYWSFFM